VRIAIVGTGGMGGYYGAVLAKSKHDVFFLGRGPHLEAMRQSGLHIQSVHGDFSIEPVRAAADGRGFGPADLVLFCTKTYDTDEAIPLLGPMLQPETAVLSLQNGIDGADRIGSRIGMSHMLAGATWISSAVVAPGVIKQVSSFRRIVLGELDGRITPRALAIQKAFEDTGVAVEVSDNISGVLWAKFIFIAAASAFGSLTRLPMGAYRGVPETRSQIVALMREVEAVGRALDVDFAANIVDESLQFMDDASPEMQASMQLDVSSGRRTELESMIGVVGRLGIKAGVPTPVANMIYAALLPVDRAASERAA
jgi:2-dehydropantoate 2-reductase